MNRQKSARQPIEILLKRALKDDLPPETAHLLNIRLRQFREKTETQEGTRSVFLVSVKGFFADRIQGWKWEGRHVKNMALTCAVAAFIVWSALALAIPATGSSSPLAESFSTLTTSLHVSRQISRVIRMQCSLDVDSGQGERFTCTIDWTPEKARARFIRPDGLAAKTLLVEGDRVTLADEINDSAPQGKGAGYPDDLSFQPIVGFLSPANLKKSLQGKWEPASGRRRGDCGENAFSILSLGESGTAEVWVDTCTFLPTRMIKYRLPSAPDGKRKEIAMSIHFSWEIPSPPRVIDQTITLK